MVITSVRVIRPKNRSLPILAYADITLDTGILLRGIQLHRGQTEDTPFTLRMPSQQSRSGAVRNIFHPINKETRDQLTEAVVAAYTQAEEKDVNEHTLTFDVTPSTPEFGQFRIHKFTDYQQLKGFASCVLDGAIALNCIAIILDSETKMLRVSPPTHYAARVDGHVSYYRLPADEFKRLYEDIMAAYADADG